MCGAIAINCKWLKKNSILNPDSSFSGEEFTGSSFGCMHKLRATVSCVTMRLHSRQQLAFPFLKCIMSGI